MDFTENEVMPVEETALLDKEAPTEESSEAEQESMPDAAAELEALRDEVRRLNEELEQKQAEAERIAAEIGDFYKLFPNADISALPDSVLESVKQGNSLAAAYALYHRRSQLKEEQVRAANQRNASLSAGRVGSGAAAEYFTPDEVRAMSQGEVKRNYKKIIESMKKWN